MARALPLNAQPGQRQAHTLARNLDALLLCQIMAQERRGPHRRAISQRAGVLVNEAINQWINNLIGGPGPATAGAIAQPMGDIDLLARVEAGPPVEDRPATHPQPLGDFSGTLPLLPPQHGLCSAQGFRVGRVGGYLFYYSPLFSGEGAVLHGCSSSLNFWDSLS